MNIVNQANTDLAGLAKASEKMVEFALGIVAKATSEDDLIARIENSTPQGALNQFVLITIISVIADSRGRYRGGEPILADTIMGEQAAKIKKYGKDSYRLSERQMAVIGKALWPYLRKPVELE